MNSGSGDERSDSDDVFALLLPASDVEAFSAEQEKSEMIMIGVSNNDRSRILRVFMIIFCLSAKGTDGA